MEQSVNGRRVQRFEAFEVDLQERELRKSGRRVKIQEQPFQLLVLLLERPGAVLSRAQLEEKLYGWNEEVGSNAVEVHLSALRRKLPPDTIRNVRGVGWTLARVEAAAP